MLLGAAAGGAAADEVPPAIEMPACALLDRADGASRAGVDLGWTLFDDDGTTDSTAMRLDVHGQWLAPSLGLGGYAIVPVSYGRLEPDVGAKQAEWTLGDVEVGAVVRRRLLVQLEAAAHVGVTLPTAPGVTFSATEITGFANRLARIARPNDVVQAVPEASYLRVGVSPIWVAGHYFARADLAVDVPVHSGADDDLLTLGRLNLAAGVQPRDLAIGIEMVNLIALEKPETDAEDRLLTFVGPSIRYATGMWQPSVAFVLPIDDEVSDSVRMVFIAGVQAILPW